MSEVKAAKTLDDKGRCCGRKPIIYKRDGFLFCPRCDAAFSTGDNAQISNWAWKKVEGGFVRVIR